MALPSSPNTITAAMINVELGRASNAPFSLNDSAVRALAGKPTGAISFSDFHSKSSWKYKLGFEYSGVEAASKADRYNATYSAVLGFLSTLYPDSAYEGVNRPGSIIVYTRSWNPSIVSFLTPVVSNLSEVIDLNLFEMYWTIVSGRDYAWVHPSNPAENVWCPLTDLRFGCKMRNLSTRVVVTLRKKSDYSDTAYVNFDFTGD